VNVESLALVVTIDHAKNLKGKDSDKLSDPFVILKFGDKTVRTKELKNTVNPVWHESFVISLPPDWKEKKLSMEVKDSDIGKDDELGYVVFDLKEISELEKEAVSTINKDLIGKDVGGTLTFHVSIHNDKELPEFNHGKQFTKHIPHLITSFF